MDIINRGALPDFIFLSFIFPAFLKIKIEQEKKKNQTSSPTLYYLNIQNYYIFGWPGMRVNE